MPWHAVLLTSSKAALVPMLALALPLNKLLNRLLT